MLHDVRIPFPNRVINRFPTLVEMNERELRREENELHSSNERKLSLFLLCAIINAASSSLC
jgi:hypothetical protein